MAWKYVDSHPSLIFLKRNSSSAGSIPVSSNTSLLAACSNVSSLSTLPPKIFHIIEGTQGAAQAHDVAIIIDVLRAATVSAYLLDAGVASITPVSTSDEAFELKMADSSILLVGENEGIKIEGFDIGNSPSEIILRKDLTGKQVVHRSSTGTQGIVHAKNARQIIFGSFVTASAILDHLKKLVQQDSGRAITLVPMYALEDRFFAEYVRDSLLGNELQSPDKIKEQLAQQSWMQQSFLDPTNANFPEDDFHLSLELDTFDFFPVVHQSKIIKNTQV